MSDIFQFWENYRLPDWRHPQDCAVLKRTERDFNSKCLPTPFTGPLRNAPVTLLYLNPSVSKSDFVEAKTANGHLPRLSGLEPLPGPDEHREGWEWWKSRTKRFGDWTDLRSKVAILQLCPYHSEKFDRRVLLLSLPSSRTTLEWAQDVLFPQAKNGDRIVICLRAHKDWGLDTGKSYGQGLFSPLTTRGGHMHDGRMRGKIVSAVREILSLDRV